MPVILNTFSLPSESVPRSPSLPLLGLGLQVEALGAVSAYLGCTVP
jgi:hypothetical protein